MNIDTDLTEIIEIIRLQSDAQAAATAARDAQKKADELLLEISTKLVDLVEESCGLYAYGGDTEREILIDGGAWKEGRIARLNFSVLTDGRIWFSLESEKYHKYASVETDSINLLRAALGTYHKEGAK